jgi:hypothetical protein
VELARARGAEVERNLSAAELADDVAAAIRAKLYAPAVRADLVLALDAIRSPGHADTAVAETFVQAYGTWARSPGYRAIWLVGPVASLCHRLA